MAIIAVDLAVRAVDLAVRAIDLAVIAVDLAVIAIDLAVIAIDLAIIAVDLAVFAIDLAVIAIDLAIFVIDLAVFAIDLAVFDDDLAGVMCVCSTNCVNPEGWAEGWAAGGTIGLPPIARIHYFASAMKGSTPGVYIKEVSEFSSSVIAQRSDAVLFIGHTEKAMVLSRSVQGQAVEVRSLHDYTSIFGGPPADTRATSQFLYTSMARFFANGGGPCFVMSVGDHTTAPCETALQKGIELSYKEECFQLLVIPEACTLPLPEQCHRIQRLMLERCRNTDDCFALLDVPCGGADPEGDIAQYKAAMCGAPLSWGAAYYPYLKLADGSVVPPSGAVAALVSEMDRTHGCWKAAANVGFAEHIMPTVAVNDALNAMMSTTGPELSINAIRYFEGKGTLIWGARTLNLASAELRYMPVKRTIMQVASSLKLFIGAFVFSKNDERTWETIREMSGKFLNSYWRLGALAGATPNEAYFVGIGKQTMTERDIKEGRMVLRVGIALTRPSEFHELSFVQRMQKD